ncbi:MAG: CHAD domain-containing protein [Chloroflexales bacterium]|nr:CHAD domain-containing protein [Chloroflexales bacterium]
MTIPQEIELKLRVIDEQAAKRLWKRRTLGNFHLHALATRHLHSIYFDTITHTLAQVQSSIRIRVVDQIAQFITFKTSRPDVGDVSVRQEYEYPLEPTQWPEAILDQLDRYGIAPHELLPIVHTITKRQIRNIIDSAGLSIAELVLDHGSIHAAGHQESFCEIEIEARQTTTPVQISMLGELVQRHVPSMHEQLSKLARGLRLHANHPETPDVHQALSAHIALLLGTERSADESLFVPLAHFDSPNNRLLCASTTQISREYPNQTNLDCEPFWLALDSDQREHVAKFVTRVRLPDYQVHSAPLDINTLPFSEGLRFQLRYQFRRMLHREQEVLATFDAESIHKMRVTLRKIRALLDCADGYYDAEILNQFQRGFRRMARFHGVVRDCDAFHDTVQRIFGEAPFPASIQKGIAKTRQKALAELRELITSAKHHRFLETYATFVCTNHSATITSQPTVVTAIGDSITKRCHELQQPLSASFDRVHEKELHTLRIRGKRLRYILECFPTILIPATQPAFDALDALQKHLGVLQDAVIAAELLGSMKMLTDAPAKKILAHLRQEATQLRRQMPPIWAACTDTVFNQSINDTIHAIR